MASPDTIILLMLITKNYPTESIIVNFVMLYGVLVYETKFTV